VFRTREEYEQLYGLYSRVGRFDDDAPATRERQRRGGRVGELEGQRDRGVDRERDRQRGGQTDRKRVKPRKKPVYAGGFLRGTT